MKEQLHKEKQEFLMSVIDAKGGSYTKREEKYFFIENTITPRDRSLSFNKKDWTPLRRANYSFFQKELSGVSTVKSIIDIGVGPGQLQELFPKDVKVVGVDFIPYEKTVDVVCDLNKQLPIKSDSFDMAFASNVFEHLYDPKLAISEGARVLKKGGTLIASVPFLLMEHQAPFDYFRYTRFALENMCKDAGFSTVVITPLGTPDEVLETTSNHFLKSLSDNAEKNNENSFIDKSARKFVSLALSFCVWFIRTVYRRQSPRVDFTLGYGIVATK
jgi:ubiquinone/menaquinone biosynthesis C-methylase UbiE